MRARDLCPDVEPLVRAPGAVPVDGVLAGAYRFRVPKFQPRVGEEGLARPAIEAPEGPAQRLCAPEPALERKE